MYELFGLAEKLNIQNCVNSTRKCVHYLYGLSGYEKKIEYPKQRKLNKKLCTLYVRNAWTSRKIEYPELQN